MKNLRQAAGLLEARLSQQLLRSCCPTYPGPCCALRCGLSLSRHQRVVRLCSLSAVMSPSSSTAAQDWGRVGVLWTCQSWAELHCHNQPGLPLPTISWLCMMSLPEASLRSTPPILRCCSCRMELHSKCLASSSSSSSNVNTRLPAMLPCPACSPLKSLSQQLHNPPAVVGLTAELRLR